MKTTFTCQILGIIIMLLVFHSCSKEDGNNIFGEWNLKSINSECSQGTLDEEFEIFQSNDMCCISLSTTEINGSVELTNTVTTCQKLIFRSDNQLEIINENNSVRDTSIFTFEFIDSNIEVCPAVNSCVNYTVIDNEIELSVEITALSGLNCIRKFVYTK